MAADFRSDMAASCSRVFSGVGLRGASTCIRPLLDLRDAAPCAFDLRARQVGDIEHVDGLFAEGGDVGRGDVEVEIGTALRSGVEQADAVKTVDLDHREAVREVLSMMTRGVHREGLDRGLSRPGTSAGIVAQAQLARAGAWRWFADALGAAALVLVVVEFTAAAEWCRAPCHRSW